MGIVIKYHLKNSNHGFSLAEIMISLTFGLLLLECLIVIYFSHRDTYRLQQSLARMQEEGRFVSFYLFQQLSQAKNISGYRKNGNDIILLDEGRLRFFIAKSSYGVNALYSEASDDKKSKLLADDVIQFHALYGVACENEKAVCRYLKENEITDWSKVVAISLAILMKSSDAIFFEPESYQFDGQYLSPSRYLQQEWDVYVSIHSSKR